MGEKKERILPPHTYELPCRSTESRVYGIVPRKAQFYDALPRDCKFAYMAPGNYATGFKILDVYKTQTDFSEMRSMLFLEDPKQKEKWGQLKSRIPYPETRVTDLPGTRCQVLYVAKELHYHNYCMRSLTPESAMSWRNSIAKLNVEDFGVEDEEECEEECEEEEEGEECEDEEGEEGNN